jgi:hypothetical protein
MKTYKVTNVEKQSYNSGDGIKLTFYDDTDRLMLVVFSNDTLYSKIEEITIGSNVELEFKKDGKYLKLTNVGNITTGTLEPTVSIPRMNIKSGFNETSRNSSIERQTAVKAAVELVVATGIKFKTVYEAYTEALVVADGFYDFIANIKKPTEEI